MKKVKSYILKSLNFKFLNYILLSAFCFLLFCFLHSALHAQCFVGGGIGLNLNFDKIKNSSDVEWYNRTYNRTNVGFTIAPKFGYYCNDRFAFGLNCSVGYNYLGFSTIKNHNILWSVNPFVRFTTFTYKNFSLILEGGSSVGGLHPFWNVSDEKMKKENSTLAFGVLNITPILCFKLTEHLQLETEVSFLSIGYNIDIIQRDLMSVTEGEFTMKEVTHNFNIGLNSSSILAMTQIRVGVIYEFNKKGGKL